MSGVRTTRASWRVAAVLVGVLAIAGCTGGDEPDDTAASTAEAAPTNDAGPLWTSAELTDAVLSTDRARDAIASVEGELAYQEEPVPVRFDILAVDAGEQATVLRLRLHATTPADGDSTRTMNDYLSPERRSTDDIRGIALQVPAQNTRFQPTLTSLNSAPEVIGCLCSALSEYVNADTPFFFTATFPALDPATKTVDLELVGFPLVTGIPVTRT